MIYINFSDFLYVFSVYVLPILILFRVLSWLIKRVVR